MAMASSKLIRVMISSRCKNEFPDGSGQKLETIRKSLKAELEAVTLLDSPLFEVWINEVAPAGGGTWDSWDTCLEAVAACDVLVILYNGDSGWAESGRDIGICHAEYKKAYETAPGKIRVINLGETPISATTADGKRHMRFRDYIKKQTPFWASVKTVDDLKKRVRQTLHDSVIDLVRKGVREASMGKFHSGEALDWSRLDFAARKARIEDVLNHCMEIDPKAKDYFFDVDGTDVLFLTHGIPASLSISAAREMCGQPFLKDHLQIAKLGKGKAGPVHLVGCHKTVSESQALALLGFPDATVVEAPFGIYLADDIQKIQLIFLENCRDESTTRHAFQRFREWMSQSGEAAFLAKRAVSRTKIIRVVANEA